eukprot:GFUD01016996.1.p1 GENE.GFUD01016996.1~~GFUD01016996.1.p1  ORF type:complete len:560 (-),score=145.92 GFUD01016996.1:221-1900(-)
MEYIENTPLLQHPLENLDLDKLMSEKLGDFGRFQKWIYFLVCLPAALTAGITLASVFTADIPVHRCQVPACDSPVIPHYEDAFLFGFANFTIPTSGGDWDSCLRFTNIENTSCTSKTFNNLTEKCENRLYSTVDMKNTVATEFDLVCGEEWKLPLSQSVFFAGVLVGAALFGHLGDVWGRKNMFLVGLLEMTVFGIAAAFAPSFLMFTIFQFFTAMGQVGVFQTVFVLGIEIVGKSKRVFCGVVIEYFFVLGEILLAVVAWYFKDWRKIQFVCVIPGILFFSYYFLLPQSIRWLVLNGKYSKAQEELKKIAKGNKVPLPTDQELQLFKKIDTDSGNNSNNESLLDLLKSPVLICRLLNVFLNWTVITMIYYGLSMNAASLAGDIFVNFALLSMAEIPGYTLSYLGMTYLGRRITLASSLLIGGVSCLLSSFLPPSYVTFHTVLFLSGKFGATAAFGTTYLYTSELFPTRVRNACVGLSSMMGRLGAIVSPYVARLGVLTGIVWLPMAVFAAAAIVSGSLTLLLPETKGKALPRTIQEAEGLGASTDGRGGYQEIGSEED